MAVMADSFRCFVKIGVLRTEGGKKHTGMAIELRGGSFQGVIYYTKVLMRRRDLAIQVVAPTFFSTVVDTPLLFKPFFPLSTNINFNL